MICPTTVYYVSTSLPSTKDFTSIAFPLVIFFHYDVIFPILSSVPHPIFPLLLVLNVSSLSCFPTCCLRLAATIAPRITLLYCGASTLCSKSQSSVLLSFRLQIWPDINKAPFLPAQISLDTGLTEYCTSRSGLMWRWNITWMCAISAFEVSDAAYSTVQHTLVALQEFPLLAASL